MVHGCTAALVAFLAAWAPATPAQAQIAPQQVEALDRQGATEIVVRREPGLTTAERAAIRTDADVTLTRRSTITDTEVVRADSGGLAEAVAQLNEDPEVVYAEPVAVMSAQSADSYYPSLWGLENVGQRMFLPGSTSSYPGGTPDADMDVPEAWTKATGSGVAVGIVDTGVLTSHPDLADQIASNPHETGTDPLGRDKRSNQVDDDGNGYVDDWRGWDFVSEYPSLNVYEGDGTAGPDNVPQDNHGHGTHVAGTVAAQRDNNQGIAGVAPGAKVMPLRALGSNGYGTNLAIAEAFDYAGRMGLRVVNASLGGPGLSQTQLTAIQAHPNTLYVIAAANDNVNNDVTPYGPCALPAANIMCVGASDENDRRASFSNYGATSVDVFAPGTTILSTYTSSAYAYLWGTSMASPNAAGVAALVLSARPGVSALDVKSAIMASTEARPDLAGRSVTGGRVNADRALTGVLAGAPVNVTAPAINGTPRQGVALGASTGYWNPPGTSYGHLWQRSTDGVTWTPIAAATGSTYTPGASDIGARLRVTVTGTNPYGTSSATSAAVGPVTSGAPVNTSPPVISGTPRRGQVLTVSATFSPAGTSYAYQWQRSSDGAAWTTIGSASSYTLTTAEREARVRVTVTATNPYGQASATSEPIGPVVWDPPVSTTAPTVTGTTQRTFTLTASAGAWDGSGNAYRYQWQRDGVDIPGATAPTYKLVKDDEGARVRVLVTATNPDGTADRASDATAAPVSPFPPANLVAPAVSGTPQRSRTLFATRGTWTGPDNMYAFQWQRDFGEGFVDIDGATGSGYTLAVADVDATVRVLVTASNPDGTIVEASEETAPVLAAGPLNQSSPTVSGTAQRGLTLTGSAGFWSGTGNGYAYQWQSSIDGSVWESIAGATSSTYAIGVADVGRHLRLLVTVTNPDGTAAAVSTATAKVTSAPPVNTVRPAVSGTAQRASTLTATAGTWTGNGNAFAYRWQRDSVDIPGATDPTYTLTSEDAGTTVRVLVTATNPDGSATAASLSTATVAAAPPVNTIRPSLSGTAQRGLTLAGTSGSWSGIGNSVGYQWQSSADGTTWTAVADATSATYAIGVGDVGRHLRLLVTVANPDGIASAASTASAKVTSAPPVNTVRPALTGTAQRASTLSATVGAWTGNGNTYAYQWQRDSVDIPGATDPTYTLTVADVGATVRVLVTATNPDATAVAASAPTAAIPSAPPVNTVGPALAGTARRGSTLTGTAGTWSGIGNSTSLQWQRSRDLGASWQSIDGATGATYALTVADVGASVRVLVTATNPEGSAGKASNATAAVAGDGPVSWSAPAISGTAQRTATLSSTPGTWSGSGIAIGYQWQRSADGSAWVNIAGATAAEHELSAADVGAAVRLLVTATNPDGSATRASAPTATVKAAPPVNTGLPTVTGAALRGTTLTASLGTWSGPAIAYAYQWQRDHGFGFTDIVGATGSTYPLGVADVGTRLRVRVTATNADASVTAASLASSVVRAGPPVNTAAPTIAGAARRTSTLTSTRGDWGGIENEYAYQWQRRAPGAEFANIAGATGEAYTLESADVGAEIRLRVTASNLDGTLSASSAATPAVAAAPPRNTELPSVSGAARLGGTLTAAPGEWTPAGADHAYAWQRDGASIAGATGPTYTLQAADVGAAVRVRITATNVDGSASATSAATARVAAPPVNTVAPAAPSGTAKETSTLTAVPGAWDTAVDSFSYTWLRCPADATAITASCEEAGTGSTYTLAAADVGRRLGVKVTAASSGGATTAAGALTATVARLTLAGSAPPSIAGNAYVGETLTGDAGRWTHPAAQLTYEWRRCAADTCAPVGDGSRYTLVDQDAGHAIMLFVTATAPGQSASAQSAPLAIRARPVPRAVSAPVVTGTAQRGRTLRAAAGTWSNEPGRFGYQWLRCDGGGCREIAGATADAYVLAKADVGSTVTVVVTAFNGFGSGSATAAPTGPVAPAPPVNTRVPVITGTAQQGATLTAGGDAWDSTPDTAYSLAWLRCGAGGCAPITGATGARYTLVAADVGHTLVAVSTAANVDGSASARSAETAVATMAGPRWRTLPLISSSPGHVGDTVTMTPGTWSGPVVTARATELMRCTNVCVPRGAANERTYTIADGDLGAILRVRESASNVGGQTTVWSARYVGPVVSAQAAAAVLKAGQTRLRNARGSTLALAKLSRPAAAGAATTAKPRTVTLRRPARARGKLVAWACPATIGAGATPPPCSAKVTLRRSAKLNLPPATAGKVRVVVVRSGR